SLVGRRDDSRRSVRRSRHPHETRKSRFFFDLIMAGQEDRHNRREFWLRYVGRVGNSRVAMGTRDRDRLRVQLTELKKRGRSEYAHLEDPFEDDVSAFIMDFGRAVVVEFSKPGNACFIYGP